MDVIVGMCGLIRTVIFAIILIIFLAKKKKRKLPIVCLLFVCIVLMLISSFLPSYGGKIESAVDESGKIELEMRYDDNNYCRFTLKDDNGGMNAIGICQFDGTDAEKETIRSLAFTTYCVQNANAFSNGELTMLYYSGEEDGFARYENGEIGLSDFPDVWNLYAHDVTEEQIENELQNIIDNIK